MHKPVNLKVLAVRSYGLYGHRSRAARDRVAQKAALQASPSKLFITAAAVATEISSSGRSASGAGYNSARQFRRYSLPNGCLRDPIAVWQQRTVLGYFVVRKYAISDSNGSSRVAVPYRDWRHANLMFTLNSWLRRCMLSHQHSTTMPAKRPASGHSLPALDRSGPEDLKLRMRCSAIGCER